LTAAGGGTDGIEVVGGGGRHVAAVEIVGFAPDRTMPPSAQTDGKLGDGMLGGLEEAKALNQIWPWLLCAVVKDEAGERRR
jgi:hypothetical protein